MEPQRLDFYKANPHAVKALMGVEARIAQSPLERSLVDLVRLRASQINGCAYCIDMHTAEAAAHGEDPRRIALLPAWREAPFYTDRERAALAWTESLTLVAQTRVPAEDHERAKAQFADADLVDLTLLIGAINAWNRFAIAFRKELPPTPEIPKA